MAVSRRREIGEEHNCIRLDQIGYGPSPQTWLQRILPMTLAISKPGSPREIVDSIKLHHNFIIIRLQYRKKD